MATHAHAPHWYVSSRGEDRHHTCQIFVLAPRLGRVTADLKKHCPAVPFACKDPKCQGAPSSGCGRIGGAVEGCPCTASAPPILGDQPQAHCAVTYLCTDPKCKGADSPTGQSCQNGCPCGWNTPKPAKPNCPDDMPKCSDSSCDGSLLDEDALNGGLKLGFCSAPSIHGCPCEGT